MKCKDLHAHPLAALVSALAIGVTQACADSSGPADLDEPAPELYGAALATTQIGAASLALEAPFLQQTATALADGEDANGDFLMTDIDGDTLPELVFIKRRHTGTNSIEVHALSGASGYQTFIRQTGTPLAGGEDANGDFLMADIDGDELPELVFIKRRNTGTNSIEVHALSGASGYQTFIQQVGTALAPGEDANGDFLMARIDTNDLIPELVFIKRRNTGTSSIEVHVLSGASGYQTFIQQTGTALAQGEDANGDFVLMDAFKTAFDLDASPELVFIKRRNTGTNSIEVHALSGASGYRAFIRHTGTVLARGEDTSGDFLVTALNDDAFPGLVFIKRRNTGSSSIEVHALADLFGPPA